MNRLRGKFCCI